MPPPSPPKFEPARLLVVDDDPILREFAVANLASASVRVETAADGLQGWERLKHGDIDIALVDLEMPVMNGFELIERVRADDLLPFTPIVVATSRDDIEAIDRAYSAGATSFVLKPLNWRVVAYQLSYVLRSAREEARMRSRAKTLRQIVRQQDQVLSAYERGIDSLSHALLDEATLLAAGGDSSGAQAIARIWEEVNHLHARTPGQKGPPG